MVQLKGHSGELLKGHSNFSFPSIQLGIMKETIKEEASGLLLQVYIDINIEKIADDVI